jgi:hypothetical protein
MNRTPIRKLPITILVAVLIAAVAPTQALAGTGNHAKAENIATTKAYIQADYTLAHTARINMQTGEAALESLQQTLSAECPQAAAASPENEAAAALSNEVIGFIRADVQVVDGFAETVAHLHWSNRKLTRKIKAYAAKFKTLAALAMPNVCGDVRAWAASGYRALPASTTAFDERVSANNVGIGEVPARLLAPYEDSNERGVLALTRQFESELVDAEARAVAQWSKILNAFELQP